MERRNRINKFAAKFSPDTILAFLPLHQPNLSSIVWSQDPAQAEVMASCDPQQFNRYLTTAFDNRLGLCVGHAT